MTDTQKDATGGIGFLGLLCLLLIGLKLTGHISLSWVWVLAPLWIPILAALIALGIVGIFYYMEKKESQNEV